MTSSGSDSAREAAVAMLLGCTRAAGPRAILGLGDGPIDPDTLEAALATRRRMVQANASTRGLAEAAIAELEAAAAALRGATREDGVRSGPVPPIRPARPAITAPPPRGPIAGKSKSPVRPVARITAAHLTPFDRLVLSILVSGGAGTDGLGCWWQDWRIRRDSTPRRFGASSPGWHHSCGSTASQAHSAKWRVPSIVRRRRLRCQVESSRLCCGSLKESVGSFSGTLGPRSTGSSRCSDCWPSSSESCW